MRYLQTIIACIVAYYVYLTISDPMGHFFVHSVNTVIHEAGHWVFFAPWLLNVAGGSIMQILVPAIFVAYFFLHKQIRAACYTSFWVANNFADVGLYIGDAARLTLPLLGDGDSTSHDWHNILGYMGWLNKAVAIEYVFHTIAIIIAASALASVIWSIWTDQEEGRKLNLGQ